MQKSANFGVKGCPLLGGELSWENSIQGIADNCAVAVTSYSRGSEDRIVSISIVALLFAAKFEATYQARMWKEDLVKQLAWFTSQGSGVHTRESISSWSLAATNASVTFPDPIKLNPDC